MFNVFIQDIEPGAPSFDKQVEKIDQKYTNLIKVFGRFSNQFSDSDK